MPRSWLQLLLQHPYGCSISLYTAVLVCGIRNSYSRTSSPLRPSRSSTRSIPECFFVISTHHPVSRNYPALRLLCVFHHPSSLISRLSNHCRFGTTAAVVEGGEGCVIKSVRTQKSSVEHRLLWVRIRSSSIQGATHFILPPLLIFSLPPKSHGA